LIERTRGLTSPSSWTRRRLFLDEETTLLLDEERMISWTGVLLDVEMETPQRGA
jgi:hypothetical protein